MILGLLLVGLLANTPQSISAATTIYNVTDSALVWGGNWAQPTYDPMAIGYYRRYTQNNGDYVQLTFTGTTISYVYMMAYNRGAVEVKLDNKVIDILDSFSRDVQQDLVTPAHRRQVIKTYKTNPGQHTIRLTLRRGDSGSERYFMDLDAFIVDIGYSGYGTYDQTNPYATFFGPWYRWDANDAYNDWFLYSGDPGAGVRFTFEGDSITWYFTRANNRGKAMITIDGGIERYYVDLWSQDTKRNQYMMYSGLGAGIHTIEIVNLGARNPDSTGYIIDVDAFIVYYGPTGNGYNRFNAGNYADSFTHTYNSNYVSYEGDGADCTNFSSQVLLSGGFTNNPNDFLQQVATDHHQWWYNAAWGFYSSETWRITPFFVDYALFRTTEYQVISKHLGNPKKGDIIALDIRNAEGKYGQDNVPDHMRMILGWGYSSPFNLDYSGAGENYVTAPIFQLLTDQHTTNRWHVPHNYNFGPGIDLHSHIRVIKN